MAKCAMWLTRTAKLLTRTAKIWTLTIVGLLTFAWLTLAPDPLPGDSSFMLFEGVDKVVHALMLWGVTCSVVFDYKRNAECVPRGLTKRMVLTTFVCMVVLSISDELAQDAMGVGRSGDILDFAADCIGIVVGLVSAPPVVNWMLRKWQKRHKN